MCRDYGVVGWKRFNTVAWLYFGWQHYQLVDTTNSRGFNISLLNVTSCSVSSTMTFDTYLSSTNSNSGQLHQWSTNVYHLDRRHGRWGELFSGDEWSCCSQQYRGEHEWIRLLHRGKVAFVAQIGRPGATVSMIAVPMYTMLISVSADEASTSLETNDQAALSCMGANEWMVRIARMFVRIR